MICLVLPGVSPCSTLQPLRRVSVPEGHVHVEGRGRCCWGAGLSGSGWDSKATAAAPDVPREPQYLVNTHWCPNDCPDPNSADSVLACGKLRTFPVLACWITSGLDEDEPMLFRIRKIPGEGDGYPLQYSCLGNPMDRGDWPAAVHGAAKSWTRLSD